MDRGQHGNRGSINARLNDKVGSTYYWKTMVFITSKDAPPSLTTVGQSIASVFNNYNKRETKSERFKLGEVVTVNARPLAYHIEEANVTKILRNLLPNIVRTTLIQNSSLMSGFYTSQERGLEIPKGMADKDFDEYREE